VTLSEIAAEHHDHAPAVEEKPKKAVTAKKVAVKK
jgi:hypothetical protein